MSVFLLQFIMTCMVIETPNWLLSRPSLICPVAC